MKKLIVFCTIAVVVAYLAFMGYCFAVAQRTALINGSTGQQEFVTIMKSEKQSLRDRYQFYWPSWPVAPKAAPKVIETPAPIATNTPTPNAKAVSGAFTQDSYGFYRHCELDANGNCQCKDYQYTLTITRQNCSEDVCPTAITFKNEFGQTMWVNLYNLHKSVEVESGTIMNLGNFLKDWDITTIPFFYKTADQSS